MDALRRAELRADSVSHRLTAYTRCTISLIKTVADGKRCSYHDRHSPALKRLPTAEMKSGNTEPEANEHGVPRLEELSGGGSKPPLLLLSQSVTLPGCVVFVENPVY